MKTPLLPDEVLVREGAANLQRGIETVGGRLYLTSHRLVFESHAFNVRSGSTVVPLPSIRRVRKCWTRLLNLLPVFPNSLAVETNDGTEFRLVAFGRQAWIEAIENQRT